MADTKIRRLSRTPLFTARQAHPQHPEIGIGRNGAGFLSPTAVPIGEDGIVLFQRGPKATERAPGYDDSDHRVWRVTSFDDPQPVDTPMKWDWEYMTEVVSYRTLGKAKPAKLGACSAFRDDGQIRLMIRYGYSGRAYMLNGGETGETFSAPTLMKYRDGKNFSTASCGFLKLDGTYYCSWSRLLRRNGGPEKNKEIWGIAIITSPDMVTWNGADIIATLDPDQLTLDGDLGDTSFMTSTLTYEAPYFYITACANGLEPSEADPAGYFHDSPRAIYQYRFHRDRPQRVEACPHNPLYLRESDISAVWSPNVLPYQGDLVWFFEGEYVTADYGSEAWRETRAIQYRNYFTHGHSSTMGGIMKGVGSLTELWALPDPYPPGAYHLVDCYGRSPGRIPDGTGAVGYTAKAETRFVLAKSHDLYRIGPDTEDAFCTCVNDYEVQAAAGRSDDFRFQWQLIPEDNRVKLLSRLTGGLLTASKGDALRVEPDTGSEEQLWTLKPAN